MRINQLVAGWAVILLAGCGPSDVPSELEATGLATVLSPLTLIVVSPESVRAGEEVTFVIHYRDGAGAINGGARMMDGEGSSWVESVRCDDSNASLDALEGSYEARHTFSIPGPQSVVFRMTTYVCRDERTIEETASAVASFLVTD